jgi:hypothetical protein
MSAKVPPRARQSAQTAERYEKLREAMILKRSGLTYEEIWLTILGVDGAPFWPSRQALGIAVQRAMQHTIAELRHETIYYRAESIDRLQALLHAFWDRAMKGDVKAGTECRLIIEAISRLTGANAPIQFQIGESDVDTTIRELDDEISRRAASVEGEVVRGQIEEGQAPDDLG